MGKEDRGRSPPDGRTPAEVVPFTLVPPAGPAGPSPSTCSFSIGLGPGENRPGPSVSVPPTPLPTNDVDVYSGRPQTTMNARFQKARSSWKSATAADGQGKPQPLIFVVSGRGWAKGPASPSERVSVRRDCPWMGLVPALPQPHDGGVPLPRLYCSTLPGALPVNITFCLFFKVFYF